MISRPELVSAVIPTRNRPELVRKAVTSALAQTHRLVEVIVVIDGEDRATEECLADVEDARLRVISLAVNVGGSEARNIGVQAANGKWIAFLDDDDEWLPEKISTQLEASRASECGLPVISSRLIVRTPGLDFVAPSRLYEEGIPLSEYLFCRRSFGDGAYAMQTSTLFVRREIMLAVPFRTGLKRHQDWDWLLRASCHAGVRFHMVPEALTVFRVEDGRPSVGRGLDSEFSLRWAQEMSPYLTRRAYSFFLTTECVPRAIKSRAGPDEHARLLWEVVFRGTPTSRCLLWLAAYICVPGWLRIQMRERLRKRSSCVVSEQAGAGENEVPVVVADSFKSQQLRGTAMQATEYTRSYLSETQQIAMSVDDREVDRMIELLCDTRARGGRVFFLGVGGGAGNASHAVNDCRKIAGIEAYAPTDNVSELTARINDDGWVSCYANWLQGSRLKPEDIVFVFSVGGGSVESNVSANIVESLKLARLTGARIAGIVGRDGGYTAQVADACVVIPTVSDARLTAHVESFQGVIWHLIVSHPRLRMNEMKWEQTSVGAGRSFSIAMA